MNCEQRYDEALERARKEYKTHESFNGFREMLLRIFPELKESEDERIRESLIELFKDMEWDDSILHDYDMDKDKTIAWLEKQESVEEIVERCKTSWYNEGKIQGKMEGLSDDEKYQQGWYDAIENQGEQKPVEWSEEDERIYQSIMDDTVQENQLDDIQTKWLTNIKYRYVPQPKQEWSEEDENMVNQIIEDVEKLAGPYVCYYKDVNWLKSLKDRIQSKQSNKPQGKTALEAIKEEKVDNANKVEPKFKIGDWVTVGRYTILICEIRYDLYDIMFASGEHRVYDTNILDEDKEAHLWTIADAKDGDVLISCMNKPFIYNGFFDESAVGSYCGLNIDGQFYVYGLYDRKPIWGDNEGIKPATKEQRDILFTKMKEAGYEWNSKKKELKKIPNSYCQENCKGFQETGKCYADGDCKDKIEAESAEKTEPNFKVGDWVVRKDGGVFLDGRKFAQITKIEGEKHWFDTVITYLKDEDIRLWTLEDAEEGDILYSKEHNLLWRYKNTKECYYCINLNYNNNNILIGNEIVIPNDVRPATQEQRDLLFDKMLQYTTSEINGKKELKEIESKFHEGDWVIGVATEFKPRQIVEVLTSGYKTSNGGWIGLSFECGMHLWTIADAKDGDVLISWTNKPFIYNGFFNERVVGAYCGLNTFNQIIIPDKQDYLYYNWTIKKHVRPATKEQRDFLFKKIEDKGYEWDNEKKELIRRT